MICPDDGERRRGADDVAIVAPGRLQASRRVRFVVVDASSLPDFAGFVASVLRCQPATAYDPLQSTQRHGSLAAS